MWLTVLREKHYEEDAKSGNAALLPSRCLHAFCPGAKRTNR